jgi:hypothetical protein
MMRSKETFCRKRTAITIVISMTMQWAGLLERGRKQIMHIKYSGKVLWRRNPVTTGKNITNRGESL